MIRRATRPATAPMQAEQARLELEVASAHEQLAALRAEGALVARRLGALADNLAQVAGYGQAVDGVLDSVLLRDLAAGQRIRKAPAGPSRRAICSMATGPYRSMLSRSALSFERYAERWGWDVVLSTEDLAEGRPASWGKVPFIRSLLDEYDWVLWLDTDVVVVDVEDDIFRELQDDKDLYIVEHSWLGQFTANAGVMLMRSCDWSREFLDAVWASDAMRDHVFWENAAVLELLGYAVDPARLVTPTRWLKRTKLIDRRYNSIELDPAPRPAFVHRGFYSAAVRTRQITGDLQCALGRAHPITAGRGFPARPIESVADVRRREELPLLLNALGLTASAVELGVRKGHFSEWLMEYWNGDRLMAIDPWAADAPDAYVDISNVSQDEHDANQAETCRRLARFGARAQVWRATGAAAAPSFPAACLDFAYLDARHDEASVREDLATWWPIIRAGGVIAGHDYLDGALHEGDFGVRSAVDDFFGRLGLDVHATTEDEPWPSWIVRKP